MEMMLGSQLLQALGEEPFGFVPERLRQHIVQHLLYLVVFEVDFLRAGNMEHAVFQPHVEVRAFRPEDVQAEGGGLQSVFFRQQRAGRAFGKRLAQFRAVFADKRQQPGFVSPDGHDGGDFPFADFQRIMDGACAGLQQDLAQFFVMNNLFHIAGKSNRSAENKCAWISLSLRPEN